MVSTCPAPSKPSFHSIQSTPSRFYYRNQELRVTLLYSILLYGYFSGSPLNPQKSKRMLFRRTRVTFGAILADNNLRKGSLAWPVQIWINNARASWKDHQIYHSSTAVAENYYNVDDMI